MVKLFQSRTRRRGSPGGGALDALVELLAQGGDGGFVGEGYRGFVVVPCEAGVIGPLDLDLKVMGVGSSILSF